MSNILPDARNAQDAVAAGKALDTAIAFQKTVADAVITAIGNKVNTASISISGKAGADVMASLQDLKRKGYKVVQDSSTTWSVSW